jgi:hypothetical protein
MLAKVKNCALEVLEIGCCSRRGREALRWSERSNDRMGAEGLHPKS